MAKIIPIHCDNYCFVSSDLISSWFRNIPHLFSDKYSNHLYKIRLMESTDNAYSAASASMEFPS